MKDKITIKQAIEDNVVFIDTRTPDEFALDHIPDAVNIPILSNEERATVGLIYKQISKKQAVDKGLAFFAARLPSMMKEINKYRDKKLIINCWRGGMRSRAITGFLQGLNYNAYRLEGGYKEYRRFVREKLGNIEIKPKFIVLSGLTCTGKTDLLKQFPNSLDLEGLAQHRSSLYGAIGLEPRSQKMFESLILQRLKELENEKYVIIEGESRRIGDVLIPEQLWTAMKKGVNVKIESKLENRARLCVDEYFTSKERVEEIKNVTKSLMKVISNKKKEEVLMAIEKKDYLKAASILLEFYYDPLYSHTLKQVDFSHSIDSDNLEKAREELGRIIE